MLIKRLRVYATVEPFNVVRDIKFNLQGLNLIVDDTPENKEKTTGNGVGKTTVIKIIDLCLGAKSVTEIYKDKENIKANSVVSEYISTRRLQAELTMIDDSHQHEYIIKRDLFNRGKRYINDNELNKQEFDNKLKEILFSIKAEKPTLRELMPKFVRLTTDSEDNIIKFMHGMASKITYNSVYSTLFRLYEEKSVSELEKFRTELMSVIKRISDYEKNTSIGSIDSLQQRENLIKINLENYIRERSYLGNLEAFKSLLETQKKIQLDILNMENNIALLQYEIKITENSQLELEKQKSNIDIHLLKNIYMEAESYNSNIQKSFTDLVNFHNTMIINKINFITKNLQEKKRIVAIAQKNLNDLISRKHQMGDISENVDPLSRFTKLNRSIEEAQEQLGSVRNSIQILKSEYDKKSLLEIKIEDLNKEIKLKNTNIDKKITDFNIIFSKYCRELYGVEYLFSYNKNWLQDNKFPVSIEAIEGNLGTGKKKGVIVAFDLAYMEYANQNNIPAPQFVIHDKMESTHINQLRTIFEITKQIKGQYIMPILRERISSIQNQDIDNHIILTLSEKNKFFKI